VFTDSIKTMHASIVGNIRRSKVVKISPLETALDCFRALAVYRDIAVFIYR